MRVLTCLLFLLTAVIVVAAQQPAATAPWSVMLQTNTIADSNLTVVNRCRKNHQFKIEVQNAPFLHLSANHANVKGGDTQVLPVKFDTKNLPPGVYHGTVVVVCESCSKEPTCAQDREVLQVALTVTAAPPATGQPTQTARPQTLGPSPSAGTQEPTPPPRTPTQPQKKSGTQPPADDRRPVQNVTATASKPKKDCCKEIREANGGRLRFMKDGNGFELAKNKLVMTVNGKSHEWIFTDPDGKALNLEEIFCGLASDEIISQFKQAQVTRVKGGEVVEKGETESVLFTGPSSTEITTRPGYFFQFMSQKGDTGEKENAVWFFMDAERCTWSVQLFADGETRWSTTRPAREAEEIRKYVGIIGTVPDNEKAKGAWWGLMYRYLGEIQEWYAWVEGDAEGKKARRSLDVQAPFSMWQRVMEQALRRMRSDFDKKLSAEDKKLIDEMVELLGKDEAQSPTADYIQQVFIKYNQLWSRFHNGVPPK